MRASLQSCPGWTSPLVSGVVGATGGGGGSDTYRENLFVASDDGFLCLACNKRMKRKDHMRNHVLTHTQGQEVSCYECGRVYKNARSLEVHISAHHRFKSTLNV